MAFLHSAYSFPPFFQAKLNTGCNCTGRERGQGICWVYPILNNHTSVSKVKVWACSLYSLIQCFRSYLLSMLWTLELCMKYRCTITNLFSSIVYDTSTLGICLYFRYMFIIGLLHSMHWLWQTSFAISVNDCICPTIFIFTAKYCVFLHLLTSRASLLHFSTLL